MGMTIDGLEKECQYCYREIDNSGLEGFRCTNRTAIKARDSSWCYPKNANEPCSICEYCKPKQNMGMTIKSALEYLKDFDSYSPYQEAIDKVSTYIEQMQADYENRLKADMVAMLEDLRLDFQEAELAGVFDNKELIFTDEVDDLVQEKINALKEAEDDQSGAG